MELKQFNHPVHCAICHGFIWLVWFFCFSLIINFSFRGLHYQGFECVQCAVVTHKKCYQIIPFWCQKSVHSVCTIDYLEEK